VGFTSFAVVLTVLLALLGFLSWRKSKAIDKALEDHSFNQFVDGITSNSSFVVPEVNTIQFLRRGYSITFDSVKYTQEGLALTGTVGNPTQLWISSLALKFTAKPYPYKFRDKWAENYRSGGFILLDSSWEIGTGQTTIGALNPGSAVPFSVTIPNVKQTSDQIQIEVAFSGERYSYMR